MKTGMFKSNGKCFHCVVLGGKILHLPPKFHQASMTHGGLVFVVVKGSQRKWGCVPFWRCTEMRKC